MEIVSESDALRARILDLWDSTGRGEVSMGELKKFKMVVEIMVLVSEADCRTAKAEGIRTAALLEMQNIDGLLGRGEDA